MEAIRRLLLVGCAAAAFTAIPTVARAPDFVWRLHGRIRQRPSLHRSAQEHDFQGPQVLENIYRITGLHLPQGWRSDRRGVGLFNHGCH